MARGAAGYELSPEGFAIFQRFVSLSIARDPI